MYRRKVGSMEDQRKVDRPIIFLDWDDTLFPTFTMKAIIPALKGHPGLEEWARANLARHEVSLIAFLKQLLENGDLRIVTNAEDGWVQTSCQHYMPNVVPYIKTIPIVSARRLFEATDPHNPTTWKVHAFKYLLSITSPAPSQVILFGDSKCECDALKRAFSELGLGETTLLKIIKFDEKPSFELLCRQLDQWAEWMGDFLRSKENWDHEMTTIVDGIKVSLFHPNIFDFYAAWRMSINCPSSDSASASASAEKP